MKDSKFMSLGWQDVVKGFIMAFISALLTGLYTSISATPPQFPTTWAMWQPIVMVGLGAGISYIIKNLFTNSNDQFAKTEQKA